MISNMNGCQKSIPSCYIIGGFRFGQRDFLKPYSCLLGYNKERQILESIGLHNIVGRTLSILSTSNDLILSTLSSSYLLLVTMTFLTQLISFGWVPHAKGLMDRTEKIGDKMQFELISEFFRSGCIGYFKFFQTFKCHA